MLYVLVVSIDYMESHIRTGCAHLAQNGRHHRSFSSTQTYDDGRGKYTEEELELVREAVRGGKTNQQIYDLIRSDTRSSPDVAYVVGVATNFQNRQSQRDWAARDTSYSKRPWTEEDVATLREKFNEGIPTRQIAASMRRSRASILRIGLDIRAWRGNKPPEARAWTDEEIRILKDMVANGASIETCALKLERSRPSVLSKKRSLGFTPRSKMSSWSESDLAKLEKLYRKGLSDHEIAEQLSTPRTLIAISRKRSALNLANVRPGALPIRGPEIDRWSAADDAKVMQCLDQTPEDIAPLLSVHRSRNAIKLRMSRLNPDRKQANRISLSEIEQKQLQDLRRKGLTWKEIGERLGLQQESVRKQWLRLQTPAQPSEAAP